ncbi:uncharacterized protein RHOBADRAFT_53523 [Rhodotorula graminis WP1]|uniref:F-box domain-containing protein n=1 Tax=Rhodotorula graminis (strain WP1) TaxID=578459 RepID=A0A194S4P6_RHOGW|nr:uncharacterized protein RHOBADRAFT_53523 [Rhodotorula graminis WP1]KPV75557.1 hypothetical protein RHOBADRAFT_53523 [Rhodotorula graminis WP1]
MPPTLRARKPAEGSKAPDTPTHTRPTVSTSEETTGNFGADEDSSDAHKPPAVPKKKRKKAAARSTKVGSSGNDVFSTLPLDLLHQICGDLDPGTLLSISQVSKPIHRTLASKSSAGLWKHICGPSRKTEAELPLRVRACAKCFKNNLKTEKQIRKEDPDLHPYTFKCALSSPCNARTDRMPYYWVPDLAPLSAHLTALSAASAVDGEVGDSAAPNQVEMSPAVHEYHRERRGYVKRVKKDAEDILAFQYRAVHQLEVDHKLVVDKRYQQLCDKVANAGFSKEDFVAVRPWADKHPVLLTDQQWARISKDVLAAVALHRSRRLEDERQLAQQRRRSQLHALFQQARATALSADERLPWPCFMKLITLKSAVPLWQPDDAVIDPSSWSNLVPTIVAEVRQAFRKDEVSFFDAAARSLRSAGVAVDPKILSVLDNEPSAFVDASDDLAPLHEQLSKADTDSIFEHAAAVVECGSCRLIAGCRRMLEHWASTTCSGKRRLVDSSSAVAFVKLLLKCIKLVGKDPATTTRKDMIDLGYICDIHIKDDMVMRKQAWHNITFGYMQDTSLWSRTVRACAESFTSITPDKAALEEQQKRVIG